MNFLESPAWAGILNFQGAVVEYRPKLRSVNGRVRGTERERSVSFAIFFATTRTTRDSLSRRDKVLWRLNNSRGGY